MECSVCCEEKKVIKCFSCKLSFCSDCVKNYLLTSNDLPHCMNCKSGFSRSFITSATTKSFVSNEYKKHRENVLYSNEQSKLPDYQLRILFYKTEKEYIESLRSRISLFYKNLIEDSLEIFRKFKNNYYGYEVPKYQKYDRDVSIQARKRDARVQRFNINCSNARNTINEYSTEVKNYYEGITHIKPEKLILLGYQTQNRKMEIDSEIIYFDTKIINFNKEKTVSESIMCKCPVENCIGYIVNNVCIKCETKICERCQKVKEDKEEILEEPSKESSKESSKEPSKESSKEPSTNDLSKKKLKKVHKCEESDIKTVEMIKKECKICPKCNVFIFRVSGCPQMWCTMCHTAFDYNTGAILNNKNIHNPHYFEFLNDNNIIRNGACNNILDKLNKKFNANLLKTKYDYMYIFRMSSHILDENRNYEFEKNKKYFDLAKQFIEGKKTEKEYKIAIQRAEKKDSFNKEENDVKREFSTINLDILYTYVQTEISEKEIDKLLFNNYQIFRKSIDEISSAYGMKGYNQFNLV